MEPILYLVHRIPYPPNKGDKIRTYNMLQFLLQFYEVHLGTFIDDKNDKKYQSKLDNICKTSYFEDIDPNISKIKSLKGVLKNQALSVHYYSSKSMQEWVDKVIDKYKIEKVLVVCSPMAQFVLSKQSMHRVIDFIDIDSDKWEQYSQSHKGLMSSIYAREAKKLFVYEKEICQQFKTSIFVSDREAQQFKELVMACKEKIVGISNGIDFSYFNPYLKYNNPYNENEKILVFTGAMDYWANCDAVIWFAENVFKELYSKNKQCRFYIVGSNPTAEVLKLSKIDGVTVTGRVEDIRPYIKYSFLVVAPLRIARGIQNKVLEAMAMNKIVVATPNAMEGIKVNEDIISYISDTKEGQRQILIKLLESNKVYTTGSDMRDWVTKYYEWGSVLQPIRNILDKKHEN